MAAIQRGVFTKIINLSGGAALSAEFELPPYTKKIAITAEYDANNTATTIVPFLKNNNNQFSDEAFYVIANTLLLGNGTISPLAKEGATFFHGIVQVHSNVDNIKAFRLVMTDPTNNGTASVFVMPL